MTQAQWNAKEEAPIERIYFSIGEIAEDVKEPTSVIRFWMNEMGIEAKRSHKNGNGGYRQITPKQFDLIKRIKYLVRVRRFTIEGAKLELAHASEK